MLRIIAGYEVLEQAIEQDFMTREQIEATAFDFSHLYTMMPNPATRSFLGWRKDILNVDLVKSNPVPDNHLEHLRLLIGWQFGTKGISRIIGRISRFLVKSVFRLCTLSDFGVGCVS